MARAYRHGNGAIQFRTGGGQFRQATLRDMGITDENKNADSFICNICGREFIPILLSGICCGVDNKRLKPKPPVSEEEQEILDRIEVLKKSPFISNQILNDISKLETELRSLRRKNKAG